MESIYLTALLFAIVGGLGATILRLPPLIGFLGAGFAINAVGIDQIPFINVLAELGVTVLLFTIGLKLNPRDMVQPRVVGTAAGHAVTNTVVFAGVFALLGLLPVASLAGLDFTGLVYVGIAASFSSTVFVMSQLDDANRGQSTIGRIALGVLVLQDIIAVGVLVFSTGSVPAPWALALPLLLLLRPLVTRMPDRMFRAELLVLTGVGIAVAAYSLFELANVSGSLGSLVAGIMLSGHPVADRLSEALISVRELLLVAFFVEIGLGGLPGVGGFLIAGVLTVLLVVKAAIFVALLRRMGLSDRTSILTGMTLANYSEFGLIVVGVGVANGALAASWTPIMAIAVVLSFVASSAAAANEDRIVPLVKRWVPPTPESRLIPDERPVRVRHADVLVLGMGRVGEGVYRRLSDAYGKRVYGIEFDEGRIEELRRRGDKIIAGDVTDPELWRRIELDCTPELFVLALPNHRDSLEMAAAIRERHPDAVIAGTALVREHCDLLVDGGADVAVYLYEGAGEELADQAMSKVLAAAAGGGAREAQA
ncbi:MULTISPECIES: cation:proton antiporter family protein [Corynebacterium]|uniref:Kef-type K+ transport protein n=1 Tax=Corynebacterium freneyi TaxID=134034 RepID=A0ABS4U9D1_9CORY|nr:MULTISPECIES: cation:proton antiporter family protein [Corynebacterium]MBP2333146.1 putative Kef-type K+ transport protein [Corynebacterium freneyi]OFU55390.1 portal protein [Corynebacterium sp. HMSC11E11]QXA52772.1 cation:proton antiporter [Corynebacterium freneyi]UBI02992.1 cation:proton antiporter [Corynebacterium freneyi]WJZ04752.1 Inner membrane protein YbaL [Corynebacterium freneyi]